MMTEDPPALHPAMDTESAFRLLVGDCCAEVDARIVQFLESDDPEGAHKARVALRRLTTTLDAFRPVLRRRECAAQRARAKAIFRALGKVRDADVYLDLRGAAAPQKVHAATRALRQKVRARLRKDKVVGFTPALLARVLDGSIFRVRPGGLAARLRPVGDTAAAALAAQRAVCLSFGDDLHGLSDEDRHDLRKALKGLRYTAEFFAPVWDAPDWPARRNVLRDMQDELGHLNDLVAARGRDGGGDRTAEKAALERAGKAWAALRAMPPWWPVPPQGTK